MASDANALANTPRDNSMREEKKETQKKKKKKKKTKPPTTKTNPVQKQKMNACRQAGTHVVSR
jgi:hypothetical protein